MKESVKAIMIGLGNTGKDMVEYMTSHGVDIVGAVDMDPALKGVQLKELVNCDVPDLVVSDNLEETLEKTEADIALVCTVSLLEDLFETALSCLNHGVNVLTTAEKALSPAYNPNKEMVTVLDQAAKKNNVTMLASGVQDILWVTLANVLSGLCSDIKEIHGLNYALIDGFGPFCLEEAFVGKKVEDFRQGEQLNDDFNYALSVVAEALKLNIIEEETKVSPIICKDDVYSEVAEVSVKKGEIIGVLTNTTIKTAEGITLCADFYEKLREAGDTEKNEWSIIGTPSLTLTMDEMYGEYTTCTTILNRIPDVINAAPGYVSVASMPVPKYHAHPMHYYVER